MATRSKLPRDVSPSSPVFVYTFREKLENLLGTPDQAELIWYPENYIQINDEKKATSILKLLDTLDNCEDVQGVYGNFEINEEIIKKIDL